ncbi:MAG: hypothetical protein VKM34_00055 [Cyanobacteriota bacterium]|nr:hypothetical protein [Cyanobacteriota bacterium]
MTPPVLPHKDTYFFSWCHKLPLYPYPEWMTLVKTMPFSGNGILAEPLIPRFHLFYHYLKGDVGIFAARRLLEELEPDVGKRRDRFVCSTSYRKFVSPVQIGTAAENQSGVWIVAPGDVDVPSLLDSMAGRIVLPQFLGSLKCMAVAAQYGRAHSLSDYLLAVHLLLRDDLLSSDQALDFLRMPVHMLWGFCAGTLRVDHFIEVAAKLELAVATILKSGYSSSFGWESEYQERWLAFFMERLSSHLYLDCLAREGLFSWQDDGGLACNESVSQGYNCNVNLPHEPPAVLGLGGTPGIW